MVVYMRDATFDVERLQQLAHRLAAVGCAIVDRLERWHGGRPYPAPPRLFDADRAA